MSSLLDSLLEPVTAIEAFLSPEDDNFKFIFAVLLIFY